VIPGAGGNETVTGINVTPMVDIMLVLLIIFMVTSTFVSEQALQVHLPKVAARETAPTPAFTVTLGPHGEIWAMKSATDLAGLRRQMLVEVAADPTVKVIVKADKDVPYLSLIGVLDAIKLSGVQKVGLAVDRQ
jgi:biopolymer transport protein ExbD